MTDETPSQHAPGIVPERGPEAQLPPPGLARGGLVNVGPGGNLDLDNLFTYHAPHGDQVQRFALIREQGRVLAGAVADFAPPSPERSTAIAKIREAVMWANAAIACHEKPPTEPPGDVVSDAAPAPRFRLEKLEHEGWVSRSDTFADVEHVTHLLGRVETEWPGDRWRVGVVDA